MIRKQALPIDLKNSVIRDSFWSPKQQLILDTVIDYQEKVLNDQIPGAEKSHAVANFRIAAGLEEGEFYGMVFQDSDVAKWLEGVAYSLTIRPDADLEKQKDALLRVMKNMADNIAEHIGPGKIEGVPGHPEVEIGVTMNTYTHLGLEDAKDEMIRLEELEQARKEVDKTSCEMPIDPIMFKAV